MWPLCCPVSACLCSAHSLSCRCDPQTFYWYLCVCPLPLTLHSLSVTCDWLITFAVAVCMLLMLLQVTCGASVKRFEMNLYVYKKHTASSFIKNIYFIYWSPLWTGDGRMFSVSCTVLNYKSSYLYRKFDGHCHAMSDHRLVCGMQSINTWLLLTGKWWYIFIQSAM